MVSLFKLNVRYPIFDQKIMIFWGIYDIRRKKVSAILRHSFVSVADQIAVRKINYSETGKKDRCGRRRGRQRHCTRKRSRNNSTIISLYIYRSYLTCQRNKDLSDGIIERLIHCGSSHFGAETREKGADLDSTCEGTPPLSVDSDVRESKSRNS